MDRKKKKKGYKKNTKKSTKKSVDKPEVIEEGNNIQTNGGEVIEQVHTQTHGGAIYYDGLNLSLLRESERRELIVAMEAGKKQTKEEIYAGIMLDYSHLGSKIGGVSSQHSKRLFKLTRQLIAIKNHLETHPKNKNDSKLLLDSVEEVIPFITSYRKDIRDLPFDWIKLKFLPAVMRGYKLSYPKEEEAESDIFLMATRPNVKLVESDDDECETVEGLMQDLKFDECETVDGPMQDPKFSRLGRLNLAIPNLVVDLIGHAGMFSRFDENEKKIWLEFKEFDEGTREADVITELVEGGRRSIEVDHTIVSMLGNFAVAAFNSACEKHVKKGEHNNLHDFEFMECEYLKVHECYHFYMIIEAIEEGNPGTYMAEVTCNSINGWKALCNFVLTDYEPSGTKATAVSYLSCLESIVESFDDLTKEKLTRLEELYENLTGPEKHKAGGEINRLKRIDDAIKEGLRQRLNQASQLHLQPDSNRTTNPDGWSDPADDYYSGMVRRAKGATCSDYDYCSPYFHHMHTV